MTRQEFIFSNQVKHRASRHLLFWILYCTYFWIQSINPYGVEDFSQANTYKFAFYSLCCFGPTCMLSAYITIYFLLPAFLEKRKYALFTASFFLLVGLDLFINYFTSGIFIANADYLKIPDGLGFHKQLGLAETNVKWAVTISLVGMGIKLTKNRYLQEQENLEISRKKTRITLQLQKSRINPELLFHSLRNIQQKISVGSEDSASLLLKLSDLLSYSLYESDTELVPLDSELSAISDFIFLKNSMPENEVNIDIQVIGNTSDILVPPILLPLFKDISSIACNNRNNYTLAIFRHMQAYKKLQVKLNFSTAGWGSSDQSSFEFIIEEFCRRIPALCEPGKLITSQTENEKMISLILPLTYRPKKIYQA